MPDILAFRHNSDNQYRLHDPKVVTLAGQAGLECNYSTDTVPDFGPGFFPFSSYDFCAVEDAPVYLVRYKTGITGTNKVVADSPKQAVIACLQGNYSPRCYFHVTAPDGTETEWEPIKVANDWPADYIWHGDYPARYIVVAR